jgi:hypothetical protein
MRRACETYEISLSDMENIRNYAMRKRTPTLVQSGLLAELLQRQRRKVIELARRRAHRKQVRAVFWSTLTWPWRALTTPRLVVDSAKPLVETVARRT